MSFMPNRRVASANETSLPLTASCQPSGGVGVVKVAALQFAVPLGEPTRDDANRFVVAESAGTRLTEPLARLINSSPVALLGGPSLALSFFKGVGAERQPERRLADYRPKLLRECSVEVPAALALYQIGSPRHGFGGLVCDRIMCHWLPETPEIRGFPPLAGLMVPRREPNKLNHVSET